MAETTMTETTQADTAVKAESNDGTARTDAAVTGEVTEGNNIQMTSASELLNFVPSKPVSQMQPIVLAYLGDAVYELLVRQHLIACSGKNSNALHRQAASQYVSAKAQSRALERIMPLLTEEETTIVKRGRNAKSGTAPKNTEIKDYRYSTAFECLIGYLYASQHYSRIHELMQQILVKPGGEHDG